MVRGEGASYDLDGIGMLIRLGSVSTCFAGMLGWALLIQLIRE